MANGNGNGMTVMSAKIVLGIAQSLLLILSMGIGTLVWRQQIALVELKAEHAIVLDKIDHLEIPPDWFETKVDRIEAKLDSHLGNGGS